MTDAQKTAVAQAPAGANGIGRRELKIILAGFGGQGILFAGKLIAYAGLEDGRELSWLPSYGPEMRGGTASCNVTLSDDPIGSPLIQDPNVLVAMNQPSLDKFASEVEPGGVTGLIGPNSDAQQLVQPVQALVSPENAQTAAQQTDDGRFCGHGGSGAIIPASVLTPALQRRGERKLHQLHGASSSCSHPAQACANAENWS